MFVSRLLAECGKEGLAYLLGGSSQFRNSRSRPVRAVIALAMATIVAGSDGNAIFNLL